MEIYNLPLGTMLIWEAENLHDTYVANRSERSDKIIYVAVITQKNFENPSLGCRVHFGTSDKPVRGQGPWIGKSDEHLRYPTKEELEEYEWPLL